MPEYVIKRDPQYLIDVINSIIEKDIILYHNLKDPATIKELFRLLCSRIGKPTSYNKLSNILKVKPETVKKYVSHLEKTHLIFVCERHSKSLNERVTSPKKFYIIDNGLKNVITPFEKGNSFENLVFISLHKSRKPFENINYYSEKGTEIDFITENCLVEAKYGNRKLTKKQEAAFKKIKRKNKQIIKNYEDLAEIENHGRLH